MRHVVTRRFPSWGGQVYGTTPPGVVSRHTLALDGRESSHLGDGWHEPEDGFRWTRERATAFLHRTRGQDTLEDELSGGPRDLGPARATIEAGGARVELCAPSKGGWETTRLKLPPMTAEQAIVRVTIGVERTRTPIQAAGDDNRALGVAVRRLRLSGTSRPVDLALSSVCNPQHWQHPLWRECLDALAFRAPFGVIAPEVQHRKVWEWVHGVAGLARLGCIRPAARALGVAAGHEPVIYWLANRVAGVYATDLYDGRFADNEATPDVLRDPGQYAPYPYPRERVHFLPMSGTHACFADETFDFVFSFCSIEHFGSRQNSLRSLQEMARVLRPGGVAVVSTEVLLHDQAPLEEIFSPWEIYETLIAPSGLLMIGDIAPADLGPYCANPINLLLADDLRSPRPHFVLRFDEHLFTSVMFFLQKP